MIKIYFKNQWKVIILILFIILGFIFWYEVLPKYNVSVANVGYDKCLNDLANEKAVPLQISQQQGNETINQIIPVKICSEIFVQEYKNICGVSG